MKAIDLIEILRDQVDRYGENLEVFIEAPGFNCEDTYTVKDEIIEEIALDNKDDDTFMSYPSELILEDWGGDRGLIKGIILVGDKHVSHAG